LFERLLALQNDVGLLAEEYDPVGKRQLGNFPQAFSHLALINTAHNLMSVTGPAKGRADRSRRPAEAPGRGMDGPAPATGNLKSSENQNLAACARKGDAERTVQGGQGPRGQSTEGSGQER
jgi:hypothetical protein